MGDTLMGRKGKKKRAFENGEKNATPKPPFVIAMTSTSGTADMAAPRAQYHQGTCFGWTTLPIAVATMACEKADGMKDHLAA
jgi:hypothetical protein